MSTSTTTYNPNAPKVTPADPELLEHLKGRFVLSEDSKSGLASTKTGRPTGFYGRHWRVSVRFKSIRTMAAHTVVFMLTNNTTIPDTMAAVHSDDNPENNKASNIVCINKVDFMSNRKAKSITDKDPRYIGVGYVKKKGCYVGRCKVAGVTYGTKCCITMEECREALNEVRKGLGLSAR